jgi:alpha-galactosidase
MRSEVCLLAAALLIGAAPADAQKYEELAWTPPMGWNSWNHFGCDVNEALIRETADAMVSSGMRDAGYLYVNIDDCWHGERDENGFIRPDPDRFPSGMQALADYVHAKGLRLGIYSDAGWKTCAGRPGSRGYEFQDALSYAHWGIDYLKYDWCNTGGLNVEGAYQTMARAVVAAGRPVVLSICEWGDNEPWEWGKEIGHLWRTTGDITACWDCEVDHGSWSSWGVLRILDMQEGLRVHAGPGNWNDPDMLEVGNGMSESEDRAHFSMWAMLAAPLLAGNDLRSMSETTRHILTNTEVIAVNQDPLGVQAFKYVDDGDLEIWFKPLADEDWAMCILNRGAAARQIEFSWKDEAVVDDFSGRETFFKARLYRVHDLWTGEDLGTNRQKLRAEVPGHDVLMVRLQRQLEPSVN